MEGVQEREREGGLNAMVQARPREGPGGWDSVLMTRAAWEPTQPRPRAQQGRCTRGQVFLKHGGLQPL